MPDAMVSGPPIEAFTSGWAKVPFAGDRAHYWRDVTDFLPAAIGRRGRIRYYEALCGHLATGHDGVLPLAEGNFPRCQRCARVRGRP